MNYQKQAEEMARKCAKECSDLTFVQQNTAHILKHIPLAELLETRDNHKELLTEFKEILTENTKFTLQIVELQKQNAAFLEVATALDAYLYRYGRYSDIATRRLVEALDNLKQQGIEI